MSAWLPILAWAAAIYAAWRLLEWAAGPVDPDVEEMRAWERARRATGRDQ